MAVADPLIEGVTVRPGDTLVIRADPDAFADQEELDEFVTEVRTRLGDSVRVLVLCLDGDLGVVRAEDGDGRA
jgi:hypothetical protein